MSNTWRYKRLFEILPGLIVWIVLLFPLSLAIWAPGALAIFMIFFLSYWLVRTFFMSAHLVQGYFYYKAETSIDWLLRLKELAPKDDWKDIYHLIIVPEYKEPIEILRNSVESVLKSDYPTNNLIYVLATEERDREGAMKAAEDLGKEFGKKIDFHHIMHPVGLPQDKILGKGPNITFAGKEILKYIERKKIPLENVIVTNMDADHVMDKKYLACLTYKYITDPDPLHKSFQPIPMFFNNIWDVPMLNRLIAMGSSFWQLIVNTRPTRLRNFSAQAQSLEALKEVNFWSTETIVEDGHQFWRTYYHYNGCHEVVPLYTPIYQDAVLGDNFIETIKEQYLQKRRWSWGVSDIAFVMERTIGNEEIPFIDRWSNALILWESHISWSTTSLILATSSWLPLALNPAFRNTVLAFNFPHVYAWLVSLAWLGMITTLVISTLLLPPHKGKTPVKRIILDWILTPFVLPISNILFSSIPALVSQTKLMFNQQMGVFRVTKKSTKRSFLSTEE
jgi:cellulose synthase/poly-beta-1,6-N-acetylglucosamine synthase-like glycosyltransferase